MKELQVKHLGALDDVAYCCALFLADEIGGRQTGRVRRPNGDWVMP